MVRGAVKRIAQAYWLHEPYEPLSNCHSDGTEASQKWKYCCVLAFGHVEEELGVACAEEEMPYECASPFARWIDQSECPETENRLVLNRSGRMQRGLKETARKDAVKQKARWAHDTVGQKAYAWGEQGSALGAREREKSSTCHRWCCALRFHKKL